MYVRNMLANYHNSSKLCKIEKVDQVDEGKIFKLTQQRFLTPEIFFKQLLSISHHRPSLKAYSSLVVVILLLLFSLIPSPLPFLLNP